MTGPFGRRRQTPGRGHHIARAQPGGRIVSSRGMREDVHDATAGRNLLGLGRRRNRRPFKTLTHWTG